MSQTHLAQTLRIIVYVLLFVSAAAAFWFGDRLWEAARSGALPEWAALLPACAFTLFVIVYSADRMLLVKRRHYPTGRAFFQIVLSLLFLGLLWPGQAVHLQRVQQMDPGADRVVRLLTHSEPDVRAAACELIGLRANPAAADAIAPVAESDGSAVVRRACSAALERLRPPIQDGDGSGGL